MKLLFDQNLSFKLCALLSDLVPDSKPVRQLGLGDEIAESAGLNIHSSGFAKNLWHAAQQGYSLDPVMTQRKFGPHYVALKTSLDNIRITTFIARESEVKIVDPSRISLTDAHGCKVKFMLPTE